MDQTKKVICHLDSLTGTPDARITNKFRYELYISTYA